MHTKVTRSKCENIYNCIFICAIFSPILFFLLSAYFHDAYITFCLNTSRSIQRWLNIVSVYLEWRANTNLHRIRRQHQHQQQQRRQAYQPRKGKVNSSLVVLGPIGKWKYLFQFSADVAEMHVEIFKSPEFVTCPNQSMIKYSNIRKYVSLWKCK